MRVHILAKDNNQAGNIALANWLDEKFGTLLRAGIRFEFHIVSDGEIDALLRRGIDKLPAMIIDGQPFNGFVEIRKRLEKVLKPTAGAGAGSVEDNFRAWQEGQMTMGARKNEMENDDDDKKTGEEIVRRANELMEQRNRQHQADAKRQEERKRATPAAAATPARRSDNVAVTNDIVTMAKSGNSDDRLVASLFEQTPM